MVKSVKNSNSMAIVPYHPPQSSKEFLQSEIERKTNEVFRNSIEVAKFENSHLCPMDLNPLGLDARTIIQARDRRLDHVLPRLTGSFPVGHTTLMIQRPKQVLGDSEIEIEIYAPTHVNKDKLFFLRKEDELGQALLSTEQLHSLFSHSYSQLQPIKKMPVLIFSHGLGVDPIEYRLLFENIASHGYVVLSLNHPSSSGFAPFSEEALNESNLDRLSRSEFADYADRLAHIQASNIQFVIEQFQHNDLLKDFIDLDKIMLAGHSLGGEASIIVANHNPKIAGCINLDGLAGNKETRQKGLQGIPVLTILSDKDWQPSDTQEEIEKQQHMIDWTNFHKKSTNSEMLTLKKVTHMDFCSHWPVLAWLLGKNELKMPLKTHTLTSHKMIEFIEHWTNIESLDEKII